VLILAEEAAILDARTEPGAGWSWLAEMCRPWSGCVEAALVGELLLRGRLAMSDGQVAVTDPTPLGHELLDEMLRNMARSRVRWGLHSWMANVGRVLPRYVDRLAARLAAKHLVRWERLRWLGITWGERYWVEDRSARAAVEDRLRTAVESAVHPDRRTAVLLAAGGHSRGVQAMFPGLPRAKPCARVRDYVRQDPIADAVWQARERAAAYMNSG
jgi:hypothetical protein